MIQQRGSGPPDFDGKNYQMWSKRMGAFLRGKCQILWDVTVDTGYVQLMYFLSPETRDRFHANNKAVTRMSFAIVEKRVTRMSFASRGSGKRGWQRSGRTRIGTTLPMVYLSPVCHCPGVKLW
jgi:hypothetical protein